MRRKKTIPIEEKKVKFSDFKECATQAFDFYRSVHPEAYDLRIYDDLPYNQATLLHPYDSAKPCYWMMFAYEEDHYLIISCDPVHNSCFYYTDYHWTDRGGQKHGMFHKFALGLTYGETLGSFPIYIQMLQADRSVIVMPTTMLVSDGNHTEAWENGDTPLPFESNDGSLILLIDAIKEAKADPDPAWKGMQIETSFDDICPMCDYAVKF